MNWVRPLLSWFIALTWLFATVCSYGELPDGVVMVAEDLELAVFASAPLVANPSQLDVDERGRVWVCEAVSAEETRRGDRIVILDDTDGDGVADLRTVFYQGPDVTGAQGMTVLGNKVILSSSPNVIVFTDSDGDDRADTKQLMFTNLSEEDRSGQEAAHSLIFGPDGRLYWSFGQAGSKVCDPNGRVMTDPGGNPVVNDGKPFRGGMVFRCAPDGSNLEVLGHNFGNNGEVAVDSFGSVWQFDQDRDGTAPGRLNYLLERGNYGDRDEIDGSSWQAWRFGIGEEETRQRWHQNDPGVVPNVLELDLGESGGLTIYEGNLLPPRLQNQIFHCLSDVGRVVAFSATPADSGFTAERVDLIRSAADSPFHPVDLSIAPDGSILVSDRGDSTSEGGVYRLAPTGIAYSRTSYDFETAEGAMEALKSPNRSARFRGWAALVTAGEKNVPGVLLTHSDARFRARGLWLFAALPGKAREAIALAGLDPDENIRAMALRIARAKGISVLTTVRALLEDPSPKVQRECAITLHDQEGQLADQLWTELALRYEREDRWFLEALGIGAGTFWDSRMAAWLERVGEIWNSGPNRDLVWRSRAEQSPELLANLVLESDPETGEFARYVRAMHFQEPTAARPALLRMFDSSDLRFTFAAAIDLTYEDLAGSPERIGRIRSLIKTKRGKPELVQLVESLDIRTADQELLEFALAEPESPEALRAVRLILGNSELVNSVLKESGEISRLFIRLLGQTSDATAIETLVLLTIDNETSPEDRKTALDALCFSKPGASNLLALVESDRLPAELKAQANAKLIQVPWPAIRDQAIAKFGTPEP